MPTQAHIQPTLFQFLQDLKVNNNRDWFQANKQRYLDELRNPLLQFIADFAEHLVDISPHYVANPKPVGGSLFRIYRDVRFGKDKSPYKTSGGLHFRHERAKDAHAPGFYLHLEPGNVFVGVGIWKPDSASLRQIRQAIVDDETAWLQIVDSDTFQDTFSLTGDALKRPPKGFDPEHPLIDDLKRKDFIASAILSESAACRPDFMEQFALTCRQAAPFAQFLTEALRLAW